MKKIANNCCAPFAGSGKLTDYRENGSWMKNQIDKGYDKVERGITVKETEDGKKFAKINKIASELISIDKYYYNVNETEIMLYYVLRGDFTGSSIKDLALVSQLLQNKFENDMQVLNQFINVNFINEISVNFYEQCLYKIVIIEPKQDIINLLTGLNFTKVEDEEQGTLDQNC